MPTNRPRGRFAFAYGRRDTEVIVEHEYSERSRVWKRAGNLKAVRISLPEGWSEYEQRGWVSGDTYYSEQTVRAVLYSLNSTVAGIANDVDLMQVFDSMTAGQKAKVAEVVINTDWEAWFNEFGSGSEYDVQNSIDVQSDMLLDLLERMGDIFVGELGNLED